MFHQYRQHLLRYQRAAPATPTAPSVSVSADAAPSIAPRAEGLSATPSMSAGPAIPAVPKGFTAIKC